MIVIRLITKRQMFSRVCFTGDVSLLAAMIRAEGEGKRLMVNNHGLYRMMPGNGGWRYSGLTWVNGRQCFIDRWNEEIEV